jgi:hypothetical protein
MISEMLLFPAARALTPSAARHGHWQLPGHGRRQSRTPPSRSASPQIPPSKGSRGQAGQPGNDHRSARSGAVAAVARRERMRRTFMMR